MTAELKYLRDRVKRSMGSVLLEQDLLDYAKRQQNSIDQAVAAMRGARDVLSAIPEGRRGNHDADINRQLRRLDEAIELATGKVSEHPDPAAPTGTVKGEQA